MNFNPNDYISEVKLNKKSKKIYFFYAFVILLSIAIIIATILIAYRYFNGPDELQEQTGYSNGRSEALKNIGEVNKISVTNDLTINGTAVEGYNNVNNLVANNQVTSETPNQVSVVQNVTVVPENLVTNTNENQNTNTAVEVPKTELPTVVVTKDFPSHNFEKNLSLLMPKYNKDTQDKVKGVYSSDEKQVFLTFDDGPSKITGQVLDVLKKYNVKATFFVLGSRVDLNPELTKRAYLEGHYIANHGYTHKYSSIYASTRNVIAEYDKTEKSIQNAIGVKNYSSHLFRFPGGSSGGYYATLKSKARKLLEEHQVAYTNWNCLTGDAEGKTTAEAQLKYLYKTAGDNNSLVILMHDAGDKKVTVEVLPQIIEHYQKEGYVFKNYYDIMK